MKIRMWEEGCRKIFILYTEKGSGKVSRKKLKNTQLFFKSCPLKNSQKFSGWDRDGGWEMQDHRLFPTSRIILKWKRKS